MNCNNNEKILSYIKKLTHKNVTISDIPKSLNDIMTYIDKYILHFEYEDISEAIKLIPKQARYLLDFIELFSFYIDHCRTNSNYTTIKIFMCDNKCNLCKIYHLLASWGLLFIDCLYINTSMSNRINQLLHMSMKHDKTIKNYILYHNETMLNLNDIFNCIQNSPKTKQFLKESYFLISSALYLRDQFTYYCGKPIDNKHLHFNRTLDRLKNELIRKIK